MHPLDFNSLLAQFWQLQVPVTLVPSPDGQGILGYAPYGQLLHFLTQDQVDFFLQGYKIGQASHPVEVPPWMQPTQEEA